MNTKPKVILLGDSQRGRYQPCVAQMLADRAEVVGPGENGRFSLYTSMRLPIWLKEIGTPDIVHWNNGLWDLGINPTRGPSQFSLEDYLTNLRTILSMLRKTSARLIWASSTPVPVKRPQKPGGWLWKMDDILRYNAAAEELMRSENIPINDLFPLILHDMDHLLDEGMCHLSDSGVKVAAQAVVACVEREIALLPTDRKSNFGDVVEMPVEGTISGGPMPGQGAAFFG
ncbi:MAG: SGNH/GDSL hydrolase family protein [Verrucomicrobiota bacterium]